MADNWWQSAPLAETPGPTAALSRLEDMGAVATSGFRTPADVERLRREGYTPATDGAHNHGDGVDLVPGGQFKSLSQLQAYAQKEFGSGAVVQIHNGTHVHVDVPGWGAAPDVTRNPALRQGAWWQDAPLEANSKPSPQTAQPEATVTGLHDGDTFSLSDNKNGRLFGADAFELGQTGHRSDGTVVPLGTEARDFMAPRVAGQPFAPTGSVSYGRPVGSVGTPGNDPAIALLRNGFGLATPQYLQGSPQFAPYMEAERLARLNRLGGFQTDASTPSEFRHGSPFAQAEPGTYGNGVAVFKDEPTPFQGLRPDIAKGYISIWQDPKSKPEDLLAYAKANGFTLDPAQVAKKYAARDKGAIPGGEISYREAPMPLIDPGDGKTGAFLRGLGDPFNMIDELGGVADTLGIPSPGAGGPRETIFNAPPGTRFGDILWNNIDQNRAILAHDEMAHPYVRLGGQLASGLAIPAVGVEGVGARAAEEALAAGASRFAAEEAAKSAVRNRLIAVGAAEGGAMGEGGGEGNPIQRLPSAAFGAATGGLIAAAATPVVEAGAAALRFLRRPTQLTEEMAQEAAAREATAQPDGSVPPLDPETLRAVNGGATVNGETAPLARGENGQPFIEPDTIQHANGGFSASREPDAAAMAADEAPSIASEPIPNAAAADAPSGGVRIPAHIAEGADGVRPEDVLPRPANAPQSLEEATAANPGRFFTLPAPDEFKELPVRVVTTPTGGKVRIRAPLDLTQSLRLMGGIQDQGGELSHLGITNEPRKLDFGGNEQFLGKLVNENGMPLDEAMQRLWEEGYFPEFHDRPHFNELLDALKLEQMGQRRFHPDDQHLAERFANAREDRFRIEQAAADGSPLVDERGAPATLEDQLSNQPPAAAYDNVNANAVRAANINLDKLYSATSVKGGDIRAAIKFSADTFGGFAEARRGVQGWQQTNELADKLGMTPESLLSRAHGEAWNAEHIEGANRLLDASATRLVKARDAALAGGEKEKADFVRAFLLHSAITEQASAIRAEAGRALQVLRKVSKAGLSDNKAIAAAMKRLDSGASVDELAQMVGDLAHDPAKLNTFVRDAMKPTWKDKIRALFYFSLLSNPVTHFVNVMGNMGRLGLETATDYAAVGVGGVSAAAAKLTGRQIERFTLSEANARAAALISSFPDAILAFVRTMRSGQTADGITKEIGGVRQAFTGKVGTVIHAPGRLLAAEDEFFKAFGRHMALNGLAVRQARNEGLRGAAAEQRIVDLLSNPTDEMMAKSFDYARYLTFQSELGAPGKLLQTASTKYLWPIIPFTRTPINIFKTAAEHSPLALAMPKWFWAEVRAGGAQRDAAIGKFLFGSAAAMFIAKAAADGHITGNGPSDPGARRELMQTGWQPYSIKVGDRYFSYSRLDPFATIIGTVADMVDKSDGQMTESQRDKSAFIIVGSIIHNLSSKTWLQGITDFTTAMSEVSSGDPTAAQRYVQRFIASWIPAPVGQAARAIDPVQRSTSDEAIQGTIDTIKSRIPFASETLMPRRDMFGEELTRGSTGSVVGDFLNPIYTSQDKRDPVLSAIQESGATIGPLNRRVKINGESVKLNDPQWDKYQKVAGQLTRLYIQDAVSGPEFRTMSGDDRKDAINAAKVQARKDARVTLGYSDEE
jgi:endonuclease YncB( thermonuclease family)